MTILGFTRKEIAAVTIILAVIAMATAANLAVALRRERDSQRKSDLWTIYDGLVRYQIDTASFPPSFEGKLVACYGGVDERGVPQAVPCDWHSDGITNIFTNAVYLANLPTDPLHNEGSRYYYISNGRYFQIYAALEGTDEDEYMPEVVSRNIMCGNRLCNFGRGFMDTPLDKSIEEYENEIRARQKSNEK
ncbi:hypothetical protein A2803_03025 [Candidatus Woesebacteria bacterium RIFCSPHIGHO2_01_FULL_44_21]|uniref:Type II secretion system protein GspG C-terminal domain-containing protein n=1 Tax=Candidatus Woesebacteria bacterium RIFCSPHIGHO2_01_FULL_44_21 TaxID=1802503 RepID=A0A1F7Z2V2_9BACT|nr:MAG: hypothetical protein A2803_03025 [Candidatus Woesebacteria bacterium RIFCSPHIGHO2_01_FULL_44_21]OGM69212.1 MAG: hypothetical protein A2897_04355 [Candidatus Woesebacteria bacterium RIFCSPLOWO2_01_FULL_44_24b]